MHWSDDYELDEHGKPRRKKRHAPLELQATVPDYMVPFAPILQEGEEPFSMFVDLQNKYDWVLRPVIQYPSVDRLIKVLEDEIVIAAEVTAFVRRSAAADRAVKERQLRLQRRMTYGALASALMLAVFGGLA